MSQRIEVELKFPVDDLAAVESKLLALGSQVSAVKVERDLYFAHPARDFAATDEALRIRRSGNANWITYKGPKFDPTTKTRREIDLPLPSGAEGYELWAGLLDALGFRPVAEVSKQRRKAIAPWEGRRVEVSLDLVDEVGRFVEVELVTDAADVAPAKACIASLAERLGLAGSERRSYLEILLQHRAAGQQRPER